jgi:hypothetical protein
MRAKPLVIAMQRGQFPRVICSRRERAPFITVPKGKRIPEKNSEPASNVFNIIFTAAITECQIAGRAADGHDQKLRAFRFAPLMTDVAVLVLRLKLLPTIADSRTIEVLHRGLFLSRFRLRCRHGAQESF